MILQRNCFSSVIVQLSHPHIYLILASHLCYYIFFFFFICLGILVFLLLVSKNAFMIKDVNHLSCDANEIAYFIHQLTTVFCILVVC